MTTTGRVVVRRMVRVSPSSSIASVCSETWTRMVRPARLARLCRSLLPGKHGQGRGNHDCQAQFHTVHVVTRWARHKRTPPRRMKSVVSAAS